MSPTLTIFLMLSAERPVSIHKSSSFGAFLSSEFLIWGGSAPITPRIFSLPYIITCEAGIIFVSNPPIVLKSKKPSSVICFIISPILSKWASIINLGAFSLPHFKVAKTFPKSSFSISPQNGETRSLKTAPAALS